MNRFSKRLVLAMLSSFLLSVTSARAAEITPTDTVKLDVSDSGAKSAAKAAKPIKYKGNGSYTFVTANFTFSGNLFGFTTQGYGKDNWGSPSVSTCVAETTPTEEICKTTAGKNGIFFDLVEADCIAIEAPLKGMIFSHSDPQSHVECVADDFSFSSSTDATITGGTGKFTTIAGTTTTVAAGSTLGLGLGDGSGGVFGGADYTVTGDVTR